MLYNKLQIVNERLNFLSSLSFDNYLYDFNKIYLYNWYKILNLEKLKKFKLINKPCAFY